jgi:gluconokinase
MSAAPVVVMGVAGCGKSAVGQRIAQALALPLIEGDEFHPASNIEKMKQGQPLQDEDRAGWLDRLGRELQRHPGGAVLTCSALKRAYRDRLRQAAPGLRFVHLALTPGQALQRVAARDGHFYPPSLVASQFEALEDPRGETGVLALDAALPLEQVSTQAVDWLRR